MKSLIVLGLPRSLTTLVSRVICEQLPLHEPPHHWEVLNRETYIPKGCAMPKFSVDFKHSNFALYRDLLGDFAEDYLIKDVVNGPFLADWLRVNPQSYKRLLIARDFAELRKIYRARPFFEYAFHAPLESTMGRLMMVADEIVYFRDIVRDSNALWDAVEKLGYEPQERLDYIDIDFLHKRNEAKAEGLCLI